MSCRFIEEYANFQIRLFKRDIELYADIDENGDERRKFCENAIKTIEQTVKMARAGMITINECMLTISDPAGYYKRF